MKSSSNENELTILDPIHQPLFSEPDVSEEAKNKYWKSENAKRRRSSIYCGIANKKIESKKKESKEEIKKDQSAPISTPLVSDRLITTRRKVTEIIDHAIPEEDEDFPDYDLYYGDFNFDLDEENVFKGEETIMHNNEVMNQIYSNPDYQYVFENDDDYEDEQDSLQLRLACCQLSERPCTDKDTDLSEVETY